MNNDLYYIVIMGRSFDKDDRPIMSAQYIPIETVNLIISQYGNIGVSIEIKKIPNYYNVI